jgi:hypothetical protein
VATLHARLDQLGVSRVEASSPDDAGLRAFFSARGYAGRSESRFTLDRR